jgi:hypothetical protein
VLRQGIARRPASRGSFSRSRSLPRRPGSRHQPRAPTSTRRRPRRVPLLVPSLDALAPFQIAFVVADLERAAREFDARLSAGPWRGWIFGPQGEGREYRGRPADWTLRLALNNRSPQYELIEPLAGSSIHAEWLADRGEGFHHVAYAVSSLAQTTGEMEAAGHPPIAHIHSFGAAGDGAATYFDTADVLGFLVEAVEPPLTMPPTAADLRMLLEQTVQAHPADPRVVSDELVGVRRFVEEDGEAAVARIVRRRVVADREDRLRPSRSTSPRSCSNLGSQARDRPASRVARLARRSSLAEETKEA